MKFFFFFFPIYAFTYNVIFVHLGDTPPPCIFTTIKQARYFNQNAEIYLLTDRPGYHFFQTNYEEFFIQERITLVNPVSVPITPQHKKFHQSHRIDPSISNRFWIYTSERFFTLYDFIQHKNLTDIVHLENDCMLYIDLDELDLLNKQLAAPFQSLKGCIPCFLFIKNREILSLLIDHILFEMKNFQGSHAHVKINDMQTLASFYKKFGIDYMTPLPTLMAEYSKFYRKKRSSFGPDNNTPLSFLSITASLFPGFIFDAAGLGIFINGNDRRHSPHHGAGTIHSRLLFNPALFSFFWEKDKEGRAVPFLSIRKSRYQIVNLHFYSKLVENYTSFEKIRSNLPYKEWD